MKKGLKFCNWVAILGIAAIFVAAIPVAYCSCGLNWYPPPNHFNGVNERGVVSYWDEIDRVDLGNGLSFPLIINFRSDRNTISPHLGSGWLLALLESHIYQLNDRNFVMVQPDGANRYFSRAKLQDTTLKDKGGWLAEINGDSITAWAECGWKLVYSRGKLVSMSDPDNRRFEFTINGNRTTEMREGGKVHLQAIIDPNTGMVTALDFNGRRVKIEQENRPLVQTVGGQNLVTGMAPSLKRLTGVSDSPKEYTFAVDEQNNPTLKVSSKKENRYFVWDPATNHILMDNDWRYTIQPGKNQQANADIQRTDAKNRTESWYFDRGTGIETEQNLAGVKRVTTYFTTGQLVGKERRIEETINGKTQVIRAVTYNEKGQIVRETDAEGTVTLYNFNNKSRLTEVYRDNKLFAHRTYDDKDRVTEEEVVGRDKKSFRYFNDGGYEETTISPSGSTEKFVYNKFEEIVSGSFSDGRGLLSTGGVVERILPKTTEKRDAKQADLINELLKERTPEGKSEQLLRMGELYLDTSLGPSDPIAAIKTYQQILLDPQTDAYSKARAYSWITAAYLYLDRSERPRAIKQTELLLSLKSDGLSPNRQQLLRELQCHGFRMLLSLTEINRPKKDEENWRALLVKYGASEDFKKKLDDALAEQKKKIAIQCFNNY